MIRVTYQSAAYERGTVAARYVRLSVTGEWQWCEVDATRRDVRRGTCDADDVPPSLIEPARALSGQAFAYVAAPHWPALLTGSNKGPRT
jgi:hypothetical protein